MYFSGINESLPEFFVLTRLQSTFYIKQKMACLFFGSYHKITLKKKDLFLKKSRIVTFAIWFCLFTYCLWVIDIAQGAVLCLREDGRVAIETGQNGYGCFPSSERVQKVFHPLSMHKPRPLKDDCGLCVDIPLNDARHVVINQCPSSKHCLAGSASFPHSIPPVANSVAERALLRTLPETNVSLISLRSVFLLI